MFACLAQTEGGREGEVIPPGSLHHWKTILAVGSTEQRLQRRIWFLFHANQPHSITDDHRRYPRSNPSAPRVVPQGFAW